MRILLVEDDPKINAVVRQALQEEGYAVDVAFDGDRAEELTFNANLKCADERSAEALEKFFRQPKAERKRPGITALPPDLAAVSRELGERMKSVREGDWLMFQSRTRAETLQKGAATPPR